MSEDFKNEQRASLDDAASSAPDQAAHEKPSLREARPWTPNKKRKVIPKKQLDKKKMDQLVSDDKTIYRGELDPRKKDPKRKPRSIPRSEELARAAAQVARESEKLEKVDEFTDFRDHYERCKASPGRLGALYATQQVRRRSAFAQEVIAATIDRSHLSRQDRAFATLLTLGVVSTQGSLDAVINRCLDNPRDIKPDVRDAMRVSTYEIIYLRKAPHAALDQGVELVRAVAPSAARLGNAVLHRVYDLAKSFPFGDPQTDIEALALLYAFPVWLAKLLVADLGPANAAALMKASNEQAPLYISVNALKATDDEVKAAFEEAGCVLEPAQSGGVHIPGCFNVSNPRLLSDGRIKRLFSQGKILVSDASAQAVAHCVMETGMPESLLEVGAGRGTKTILLQSDAKRRFSEQVALTAMDSHGFKSDMLKQRAQEYGVSIRSIITGNATRLDSIIPEKMFSCIFIDAPCSGLGTLRRHHEIRWRITPEKIDELAATGLALLKSAAGHVEVSGSIVYSTCTVTYAENNGVVKAFLESEEGRGFALAPINGKACFTTELHSNMPDAHFAARFVRKR